MKQLRPTDKRILIVGVLAAAAILLYAYVLDPWRSHWHQLRTRQASAGQTLQLLGLNPDSSAADKREGILRLVPAFEMPHDEETQRLLFKKKCTEQFKKVQIEITGMQFVGQAKTQRGFSGKVLRMECRGKCKYDQALNLLADLNENPYLVAVEAMRLKVDPKKREEMELELTLSTLVGKTGR